MDLLTTQPWLFQEEKRVPATRQQLLEPAVPLPPRDGVGEQPHNLPDFSEAKDKLPQGYSPHAPLQGFDPSKSILLREPCGTQICLPSGDKAEPSKISPVPVGPSKGMLFTLSWMRDRRDNAPHPFLDVRSSGAF